ncbi:MAG: sigma-70 family RNA polymerase sigma factor [Acidimicrobiia bacterium]|nr:sigma-70 family RNA polymerase sigma factor [Acidimicrobiia bacterium]
MNGQPTDESLERAWRDDRSYLVGLASRMLGGAADAEDVVQDAFGRLMNVDRAEIRDVRAWLTVTVRRLCLNRLQSARARRESVAGAEPPEPARPLPASGPVEPADRVTLDDQVRRALSLVLDRLTPPERTAFVLHDVFGLPFTDIGGIVGRTPTACRQLASRARRAVRDAAPPPRPALGAPDEQDVVAERFIAACAGGDMAQLLAVLDPHVVGEARLSSGRVVGRARGADEVAAETIRRFGPETATALVPLPIEGRPGVAVVTGGRLYAVLELDVAHGVVRHIHSIVLPGR